MYKARRFFRLAELPDARFSPMLADGLALTATHVAALSTAIGHSVASGDHVAGRVLEAIAREEIGKYLILADAARIDRTAPGDLLTKQLGRCSQHLAKALYYRSARGAPASFAELRHHMDRHREDLYLDGPNGVDWIFRNELIAGREDAMYVDLHETEDGLQWHDPAAEPMFFGDWTESGPFALVAGLHAAGLGTAEGLKIVHEIWKDFHPADAPGQEHGGTRWEEGRDLADATLQSLDAADLVTPDITSQHVLTIREHWTFPLYELDLTDVKVGAAALIEKRRIAMRFQLWNEADYDSLVQEMWSGLGADEFISLENYRHARLMRFLEADS